MKPIINNLKELRHEAGLTLQALGDLCGFSKVTMHNLEGGQSPRLEAAYRIAKVLGVSVYSVWPDNTEIIIETITVRRCVIKNNEAKEDE